MLYMGVLRLECQVRWMRGRCGAGRARQAGNRHGAAPPTRFEIYRNRGEAGVKNPMPCNRNPLL